MNALFKYAISLALALVISLSAGSGALADRRVALVIGNARYQHADVLPNVGSDANAVADLLEKAGFDVVDRRSDLGIDEFKKAVSDFSLLSFTADVAVVYFSGYGLVIDDGNYLIAADAKLSSVRGVRGGVVSRGCEEGRS